jgi:hypothetical protein
MSPGELRTFPVFEDGPLNFAQFAGVGREQAEPSSGIDRACFAALPELHRQGSLLPAYKKINRLLIAESDD